MATLTTKTYHLEFSMQFHQHFGFRTRGLESSARLARFASMSKRSFCLDRIYPLFPNYMAARFELFKDEGRLKKEEQHQGHGGRRIVGIEFVRLYDVYQHFYDSDNLYWMR